jgi:uncharacterized protein YecT (DUF1311 family)
MRAGRSPWRQALGLAALTIGLCGLTPTARAIDNPNAPDRVASFEYRAKPFEQQLEATDGGGAATKAGQAYAAFLDAELNIAYRLLLSKLDGAPRSALVESQRQWLRYRDSERRFIAQHWTPERNGSSASLSVQGYANAIVKERVLQLLRYTAEYR